MIKKIKYWWFKRQLRLASEQADFAAKISRRRHCVIQSGKKFVILPPVMTAQIAHQIYLQWLSK